MTKKEYIATIRKSGLIACLLLILSTVILTAQDTPWEKVDEGEIEDASFIVEKSLEIELPRQNREFEKVPPLPSAPSAGLKQSYNYLSILPDLPEIQIPNRALKLKSQPLEKFYGGNITAGFGNYITPLLNVDIFNKRENKYALGFKFDHISSRNGPVDSNNSGSAETGLSLEAKYYGKKLTTGAQLGYDRNMVHFYGYPDSLEVKEDSIKQVYNTYNIGIWLGNTDKKDDFDYVVRANYSFLKDKYETQESRTEISLESNYFLREGLKFYLDVHTMISSYSYEESLGRHLVKVKPYIYYRYNEFDIRGGFSFVIQNDTLSTRGTALMFPFIRVDYNLSDRYRMFLNIDGDMEQVDLQSVADQNPFIDPGAPLLHSNRKFGIEWGIQGNIRNYIDLMAGARLSEYNDLYFFINDSLDISKFRLIYEHENTSLLNIYGEMIYSRARNYHVGLRADYFSYNTKTVAEAWHRPKYSVTGSIRYNLYDKIVFGSNIYLLGGMKAYDYSSEEVISLGSIVDLNLDIKYLFSDRLGVFLKFNNLLGRNYERYWRYPSRGIQILGGASINF